MFKVRCSLCIRGMTTVWLHRDFDLPFAPTVGIELSDQDWSCVAAAVAWEIPEQRFFVSHEDDDIIYKQLLRREEPQSTLEERTAQWVEVGWKLDD